MDHSIMFLLAMGLLAVCALGIVFGWLAFFRVRALEKELDLLRRQQFVTSAPAEVSSSKPEDISDELDLSEFDARPSTQEKPTPSTGIAVTSDEFVPVSQELPPAPLKEPVSPWYGNWMVWLGGLSIALAGIFMVRYSIEAGLLGPTARITLAIFTGIGFHALAEWLRHHRGPHAAFAALAGGASITLFGALLAALHLYQLLNAQVVFGLLALVSLATMSMALRHGPVLAAIGLLGAYVVPILVSTGQGNMVAAMVYALIVSSAALLLLRYVFRPWLWWGVVIGLLGWWWLSLDRVQASDFRGIYLAIACYLLMAVSKNDWLLHTPQSHQLDERAHHYGGRFSFLQTGLFCLIMAWGYSVASIQTNQLSLWHWAPLVAVIGLAARKDGPLRSLPWITLITLLLAILSTRVDILAPSGMRIQQIAGTQAQQIQLFALEMALLYCGLGIFALKRNGFSHTWGSLACLSPLLWLALIYLLTGDLAGSWKWSVATIIAGLSYGLWCGMRLRQSPSDLAVIWLTLASHLAYSLAVAMYFREASLTLALAVQLISLTWLTRNYALDWMHWLIKAVLTLVILRLTFNPWLLSYPADIHWSLWTYGGSTLCCFVAARLLPEIQPVRQWLVAASLHLFVLTLAAEVRYWLYDGNIFSAQFTFREAAINTSLWAALALSYYHRSHVSEHLQKIYQGASIILMLAAVISYGLLLSSLNPLWNVVEVSGRPLFNLLLLAYGMPVCLALLTRYAWFSQAKRVAGLIAGLGLLVFVSLEIHHLWQGGFDHAGSVSNGELYTYSVVWLTLAVVAIIAGSIKSLPNLNNGGLALLAVVIGKIFLVDMADLEGLLRVASFMGLGLSLLGLAYLRTQIAKAQSTVD